MSQRSIIEINHDCSGDIAYDPAVFHELVLQALASGSDRSWEPLKRFGITRIAQCHHSEDRKVVVADREYHAIELYRSLGFQATDIAAQDPSRHSVRRSNASSSASNPDSKPPVFSASKSWSAPRT